MYQTLFMFKPTKKSFIKENEYESIIKNENEVILGLKDNILVGYAESFSDAMDVIYPISDSFLPNSIVEIKITNGFKEISGTGETTESTILDLSFKHFQINFRDVLPVTISIKGELKPDIRTKSKGTYKLQLIDTISIDRKEAIVYCSLKGDMLSSISSEKNPMNLNTYEEEIATQIIVKNKGNNIYVSISIIGIKADTGEKFKRKLFTDSKYNERELKTFLQFKKYHNFIKKGINLINKKEEVL